MKYKIKNVEFASIKKYEARWKFQDWVYIEKYKHIWVLPHSSQCEATKKTMEIICVFGNSQESVDAATLMRALLRLSSSQGMKSRGIIFKKLHLEVIMGKEKGPREKTSGCEEHWNFNMSLAYWKLRSPGIARIWVGFNPHLFVLDFYVLFFTLK